MCDFGRWNHDILNLHNQSAHFATRAATMHSERYLVDAANQFIFNTCLSSTEFFHRLWFSPETGIWVIESEFTEQYNMLFHHRWRLISHRMHLNLMMVIRIADQVLEWNWIPLELHLICNSSGIKKSLFLIIPLNYITFSGTLADIINPALNS